MTIGEEALLCKVATEHDVSEGYQLQQTPGWATLLAILKESGERPPKRSYPSSMTSTVRGVANQHHPLHRQPSNGSDTGQLAKRVKGVSLKGD
jgi:nuclear protein localization family protein 4